MGRLNCGVRGFSLIELMIAVGISSLVALVTVNSMVQVGTSQQRSIAVADSDSDTMLAMNQASSIPNLVRMIANVPCGASNAPFNCVPDANFARCRNGNGTYCDRYSLPPEGPDGGHFTLQYVKKNGVLDSKITLSPHCAGQNCDMHIVTVTSGLAPVAGMVRPPTVREIKIPNFLVSANAQQLNQINFSCSLAGGILTGIDYTTMPGTATCLSATNPAPGAFNCAGDTGNNHILNQFGSITAATGCTLPSSVANTNCTASGGGIKIFGLVSSGAYGCDVSSASVAATPPATFTLPHNQWDGANTFGTPPANPGTGFSAFWPKNLNGSPSSNQTLNPCAASICLGSALATYLNANDCVYDSQNYSCPQAGSYKTATSMNFLCRCIGNDSSQRYCAISGRPFSGGTISVGPSYDDNIWYMDGFKPSDISAQQNCQ